MVSSDEVPIFSVCIKIIDCEKIDSLKHDIPIAIAVISWSIVTIGRRFP